MTMKNSSLATIILILHSLSTTFTTVIRNNITYENQKPYTTVIMEKTTEKLITQSNIQTETRAFQHNRDVNEKSAIHHQTELNKKNEPHEANNNSSDKNKKLTETTIYTEEQNNNPEKRETEGSYQITENIANLEITTCTEINHRHDETMESQIKKEDHEEIYSEKINHLTEHILNTEITTCTEESHNHKETSAIQEEDNKILDSKINDFYLKETSKTAENINTTDLAPYRESELKIEPAIFLNHNKTQTPINKYDYIKEKLKPALSEKLKVKEAISRSKRQSQVGNNPTQSNHSAVYRAFQTVSVNNQKPNYYAHYENMPQKPTPVYYNKAKAVAQTPTKTKVIKSNYYPPNSGYFHPIDSYLAYSNINNVNKRYPTINNANRRQFQQNRPPVPTRRTTPRPAKTQRKKFRPLPVFA